MVSCLLCSMARINDLWNGSLDKRKVRSLVPCGQDGWLSSSSTGTPHRFIQIQITHITWKLKMIKCWCFGRVSWPTFISRKISCGRLSTSWSATSLAVLGIWLSGNLYKRFDYITLLGTCVKGHFISRLFERF